MKHTCSWVTSFLSYHQLRRWQRRVVFFTFTFTLIFAIIWLSRPPTGPITPSGHVQPSDDALQPAVVSPRPTDDTTLAPTGTSLSPTELPLPRDAELRALLDDPLVFPPRKGEKFITTEEYLDCLAARLHVDRKRRVELTLPTEAYNTTIPYLIIPCALELRDIKGYMCNITVPVRHLTYVLNSDVEVMGAFFRIVRQTFSFTSRLQAHDRGNIGYAGSFNLGVRDALSYSAKEVPFVYLSNSDVRVGTGLLEKWLPEFYAMALAEIPLISELEAEVATEPNEHTPVPYRKPLLRATGNDTYLVTSRLLPDRIRYKSEEERRRAFAGHYGSYLLSAGLTGSWFFPRLALETVGLMDENFYPAYYEDTDWGFRARALGFREFNISHADWWRVVHFSNALLKSAEEFNFSNIPRDMMIFARTFKMVCSQFSLHEFFNFKWKRSNMDSMTGILDYGGAMEGLPHNTFPVDAWVWNMERREASYELQACLRESEAQGSADSKKRMNAQWRLTRLNRVSALHMYRDGDNLRKIP